MRRWHRWTMTVFGVVLAYWVTAGLTTAIYDVTDRTQVWALQGGGPGERLTDFAAATRTIPDPATLEPGLSAAIKAAGPMAIAGVDLRMRGAAPRLQLARADGDRATMRRFYADTGAPMSDVAADGDPFAKPSPNVVLRNTIKSFHKGDAFGLPGQIVGLLAGLALITLTVTGVTTYVKLWNARRKTGRGAFFWTSGDSLWRRLHRWTAMGVSAFVLNIAVTGTVLAFGEIQLNIFLKYHVGAPSYPMPTPMPALSSAPLPPGVPAMLETGYRAAKAAATAAPLVALTLVERSDGAPRALATFGGDRPKILAFDARTGAPVRDWTSGGVQVGNGYFADWHQILKRLHRGDIIGDFSGRYIDIATGLALLYLVISSFVMYADLWRRRARSSRKALFWP